MNVLSARAMNDQNLKPETRDVAMELNQSTQAMLDSEPSQSVTRNLEFKNGNAFFEYQCKYGCTEVKPNTAIIAIVLDAQKELDAPSPVLINKDGSQFAALRVVSDDGGFLVFANTLSNKGDKLKPDDVVLWVPSAYVKEMGNTMSDNRSGWIGLIRAKVNPRLDLNDTSFSIACRYD
jgi:hypothetical protein